MPLKLPDFSPPQDLCIHSPSRSAWGFPFAQC
jgi:hypothetical protein